MFTPKAKQVNTTSQYAGQVSRDCAPLDHGQALQIATEPRKGHRRKKKLVEKKMVKKKKKAERKRKIGWRDIAKNFARYRKKLCEISQTNFRVRI